MAKRTIPQVGTAYDTQIAYLGYTFVQADVSDQDRGEQVFVFKKVLDDVAVSVGSPVGEGNTAENVTADQSAAGAAGIVGRAGGLSTIAVSAGGGDKYGFVQVAGINRYDAKAGSGTVSAGNMVVWDGDDTIDNMAAGEEHLVFAKALANKNADNEVAAGSLRLLP